MWIWRAEEPGVLQSMGLQRVRHELTTEQQQFENVDIMLIWQMSLVATEWNKAMPLNENLFVG